MARVPARYAKPAMQPAHKPLAVRGLRPATAQIVSPAISSTRLHVCLAQQTSTLQAKTSENVQPALRASTSSTRVSHTATPRSSAPLVNSKQTTRVYWKYAAGLVHQAHTPQPPMPGCALPARQVNSRLIPASHFATWFCNAHRERSRTTAPAC